MSFKLLIFAFLLLAATSLHLNHEPTTSAKSTPCAPPGTFNASTGNCDCVNGSVADPKTATCICPAQKPYLAGNQCIACDAPNYFDASSNTCKACEPGTTYSKTSGKCEKVGCTGGKQLDSKGTCACPKDKQYEYAGTCNQCQEGYSFSQKDGTCLLCGTGGHFNSTSQGCDCDEEKAYFWNNHTCILCAHPKYFDFKTLICDGCPNNQSYNINTMLC